jgi:ribosomal protein S18 acetylase RimI-like enzyme
MCGVLALEAPWVHQFAVFPEAQRTGIGTALLDKAREVSPSELRCVTFRRNVPARAFYEKHGFTAVAFGVSPAPELEADVELRWVALTLRSTGRPGACVVSAERCWPRTG